jgi:hypothetical protein
MLIRSNPGYRRTLRIGGRGVLVVTARWIIATGMFAACWS